MKNQNFSNRFKIIIFILALLVVTVSIHAQYLGNTALFIVADANNLNTAENNILIRLEDMEFEVLALGQDEVDDSWTDGTSLVVISATVTSTTVAENMPGLIDLTVPIVNWEPALYDALGHQETDGGEFSTSEIDIVGEGHPLAAGLSGIVTITEFDKAVSYGTPVGDVITIATSIDSVNQVVLFGYESGAEMAIGTAPARRVGTFLLNDVADALTEDGWALFDASIMWAMGGEEPDAVEATAPVVPLEFSLDDNYPNPFNPVTMIGFSIPRQTNVRLNIYSLTGKKLATLVNESRSAGKYSVTFDASNLSSGIYLYRLDTDLYTMTKKMVFIK